MTKFEELQAVHENLLEQSKAPGDVTAFVTEVQRDIQQMCVAAEDIPAPRERDQLRAILRFWASYVYDHTGTYPDTTPRPAKTAPKTEEPPPESDHTRSPLFRIALAAGAVLILLLVVIALAPQQLIGPAPTGPSSTQPQIQWNLITSGPSPFDANVWVVKLQLSATGGDGNYIFWVDNKRLPDASDNQFTVEGNDCVPQKPVVGVTSGGLATSLELVIQSPLPSCPQP